MYKPIRSAELVSGGNVVKQGEYFTLTYQLFDEDGRAVNIAGNTITVKIANNYGVVFESTATILTNGQISFAVNEDIGYGEMRIELTVTNGTTIVQKYPSDGWIKLDVTPSLDDLGYGGVNTVTVASLKNELTQMQNAYKLVVDAEVSEIDGKATDALSKSTSAKQTAELVQTQLDQVTDASTIDPAVAQMKVGADGTVYPSADARLRAENNELTSQLVEKAKQADLLLKADKSEVNSLASGKADITYVNSNISALDTKINSQASGSPKGTYATLALLQTAFPTGNANIYVVTTGATAGHWYYWNGSVWTDGGVYQSTGIPDKSISPIQTNFFKLGKNLFDKTTVLLGYYVRYDTGGVSPVLGYCASDYVEVSAGETYTKNKINQFAYYDANKIYKSGVTDGTLTFTVPAGVKYARFTVLEQHLEDYQIEKGTVQTYYEPYKQILPTGFVEKEAAVYTVAKFGGNYSKIKDAVTNIKSKSPNLNATVQIFPGIYEEVLDTLKGSNNNISLFGVNKRDCILIDKSGDYYKSPLQMSGKNFIRNLTIIANNDAVEVTPSPPSYAAHLDYVGSGVTTFEDCVFESYQNSAVGIGTHQDQTIIFKNCDVYKDAAYGGAFYLHNAVLSGVKNQKLILDNCRIIAKQGYALRVDDANMASGDGLGNDMEVTFINCVFYSEERGLDCVSINRPPNGVGKLAGNIKLNPMSYGNNIAMLNA